MARLAAAVRESWNMSALFGPVIQQGYVVPDVEAAMRHWIARGIDRTVAELETAGRNYVVRQRYGDGHAYLDSADEPGVMIQLMARSDHLVELMETIREASIGWDGVTAPVRRIDWSSGRPVPEVVEG